MMKQSQIILSNFLGHIASTMVTPFLNSNGIKKYRFEGYKTFTEIFPDDKLSAYVASALNKKVDEAILCEELYLVRQLQYDGRIGEITDFTGCEYLVNIERIRLTYFEQMTTLPENFAALALLQSIDLVSGAITEIPDWVWSLPRLKRLQICQQKITEISPEIQRAKRLEILVLSGNQITVLPHEVLGLKALKKLVIADNPLQFIPIELSYLPKLEVLNVEGTQVDVVPLNLALATNLKELNIRKTKVTEISDVLYQRSYKDLKLYRDIVKKEIYLEKQDFEAEKGLWPGGILVVLTSALGLIGFGATYLNKHKTENTKEDIR